MSVNTEATIPSSTNIVYFLNRTAHWNSLSHSILSKILWLLYLVHLTDESLEIKQFPNFSDHMLLEEWSGF